MSTAYTVTAMDHITTVVVSSVVIVDSWNMCQSLIQLQILFSMTSWQIKTTYQLATTKRTQTSCKNGFFGSIQPNSPRQRWIFLSRWNQMEADGTRRSYRKHPPWKPNGPNVPGRRFTAASWTKVETIFVMIKTWCLLGGGGCWGEMWWGCA